MADLNRIMEALRNADAAGNAEDARKLAVIADRLRKAPIVQAPEMLQDENIGAFPFLNRAIATTLGAPTDIIRGGFYKQFAYFQLLR